MYAFHKDDILLIWQSGHEFFICNSIMLIHSYNVSGSTVLLLFFCSDGEFAPTYSPFWSNSTIFKTLAAAPDSLDSESLILTNAPAQHKKQLSWPNRKMKLIGEHTKL